MAIQIEEMLCQPCLPPEGTTAFKDLPKLEQKHIMRVARALETRLASKTFAHISNS